MAATDFFTVEVATFGRLVTYYVLVVIELSSREVHIAGITPRPDSAFMMQVGRNLTDPVDGFLLGKRFLTLDRDTKFTAEFRGLVDDAGTEVIRLPHRSPNLNAHIERFALSIESERLNRMIFFGEQSLRRAVAEFVHHYHGELNHQGLDNRLIEPEENAGDRDGDIQCRQRWAACSTTTTAKPHSRSSRVAGSDGRYGRPRICSRRLASRAMSSNDVLHQRRRDRTGIQFARPRSCFWTGRGFFMA